MDPKSPALQADSLPTETLGKPYEVSNLNSYRKSIDRDSLVAQMVKNLPAMQETQVQSLGQEDPLEKEMATHSSILAWESTGTLEPGGLQSTDSRVRHN